MTNFEIKVLERKLSHLKQLKSQSLWHELTVQLLIFVKDSQVIRNNIDYLEFYHTIIEPIEKNIRLFPFVEILSYITPRIQNPVKALVLIESIEAKIRRQPFQNKSCQAFILVIKVEIILNKIGDERQCLDIVSDIQKLINDIHSPCEHQSILFTRYYQLASKLYERVKDHTKFYITCMKFLYCSTPASITAEDKYKLARQLSVAALLSDEVYHFDELLQHPIMRYLKESEYEWLLELLNAFAIGDVGKFHRMRDRWSTVSDLVNGEKKLKQKVGALSVAELAIKQQAQSRILSFANLITQYMSEDEIEWAVMRAFRFGLIKGKIDEINREVYVDFIKPKDVMNIGRLPSLINKIDQWTTNIDSVQDIPEWDRKPPCTG